MRTVKRIAVVVFIAILGLVLGVTTGCRKGETPEERAAKETKVAEPQYDNSIEGEEGIKNAVRGYNKAMIDANMQFKLASRLLRYASKGRAAHVGAFIEERRKENAVMRSELSKLVFTNISSGGDRAAAYTQEKWHYDYVAFDDGRLIQPMTEMDYTLIYMLARHEDRWLVYDIEELTPPEIRKIEPQRALFDR